MLGRCKKLALSSGGADGAIGVVIVNLFFVRLDETVFDKEKSRVGIILIEVRLISIL